MTSLQERLRRLKGGGPGVASVPAAVAPAESVGASASEPAPCSSSIPAQVSAPASAPVSDTATARLTERTRGAAEDSGEQMLFPDDPRRRDDAVDGPASAARSDHDAEHGVMAEQDAPKDLAQARPRRLAERLRRLAPSRAWTKNRPVISEQELASQLGAEVVADGVLCLDRSWPLRRRHGRVAPADCIDALAALLPTTPAQPEGWLLLDTETSGLAGGTGTWVFVFGAARFDGDCLRLRQHLLTRLDAEPAFIAAIAADLAGASLLISYNGKSFDLPLLETRFRLSGRVAPLAQMPHLDLLHGVRRAFASRWPDCRLATAERQLLGFVRDDDLPGSQAPEAWLDWLRGGDPRRLGAVLRHNRLDLLSLAALVPALAAVERAPLDYDADSVSLARHLARRGEHDKALAMLSAAHGRLDVAGLLLLASLHRRRGDWPRAVAVWDTLAAQDEQAAIEALAKYHEHRSGNLRRALVLAKRIACHAERTRRCARLEYKIHSELVGKPPCCLDRRAR
jgi:uncharacterized protein YprB with RNaseH-like and TPR domain